MSYDQPRNLAEPESGRPVARIDVWGYGAVLDGRSVEIGEELTYCATSFTPTGTETVNAMMGDLDSRGGLQFPTGLVPRVAKKLGSMGYEVVITDHRQFPPQGQPDAIVYARSAGSRRRFYAAIAEYPLGRIEARNVKDVVTRIVELYRLFPEAKIVVGVATRKRARGLWWLLTESLGEPVGREWGEARRFKARITISTFAYFNAFDPREVDVLLLPDADEVVGETAKKHIPVLTTQVKRVYAFEPPNHRASDAERLSIEAMAGEVIHRIGNSAAQVQVSACPVTLPLRVNGLEGLERKRRGLWNNARRNALVGRVARAVAARELHKLVHLGVTVAGDVGPWLHQLHRPRVFVLVESLEHARELQKNLTDWAVLSARPAEGGEERQAAVAVHPRSGIVTLTYMASHRIAADVLVVADGVNALASCRGFPPPAGACVNGRVMLVDFQDNFDEQSVRDSRRRFREYAARGWTVTGMNPLPAVTPCANEPTSNGHAGTVPSDLPTVTATTAPTRGNPTVAPTHSPSRTPGIPTSHPAAGSNRASSPEGDPVPGTAPPTRSRSDARQTDGSPAHNRKEAAAP